MENCADVELHTDMSSFVIGSFGGESVAFGNGGGLCHIAVMFDCPALSLSFRWGVEMLHEIDQCFFQLPVMDWGIEVFFQPQCLC